MPVEIVVQTEPSNDDVKLLYKALLEFNTQAYGAPGNKPYAVLLSDSETGETLGGLYAACFYGWFYISILFIPESLRNKGFGTKLLAESETYARQQGCLGICLDTFSFQAPGFYERAGYEKFGELPDFPPGHSRVYYRKMLLP